MPTRRNLMLAERSKIVEMKNSGKTFEKLQVIIISKFFTFLYHESDHLQVSIGCCHLTIQKYQEYGIFDDLPKKGRPKKITDRARRSIIRTITSNPFATSNEIKSSLPENVDVSTQTIRRELVNDGYRAYKAKKKPLLTSKHIQARLSYGKKIMDMLENQPNYIIFSDETRISLMMSDKPALVRRKKNTSLDEKYLKPTVKFAASIMVWACISTEGKSEIYFVDSTMNNQQYIKVLDKYLRPFISKSDDHELNIHQDDNAPAHRHQNVVE
ncbi:MAG: hypothetical protein MHMPM18_005240 [Marteilia pararefringens]